MTRTNEEKELFRKFLAGAFFIVGILVVVGVVFTIGRDKGFGQKRFPVRVLFRNVGGLVEGAPARLAGVTVGTVERIEFLPVDFEGRHVEVTLSVFEKFRGQLNTSVRFVIKTEGILGEKLVEIYRTAYGPRVDVAKPVLGEDPMDAQDLAVVFADAAESFTLTARKLGEIDLKQMADLMNQSSRALLETSQNIDTLMGEFKALSHKSKRLIDRIEKKVIEGDLFRFF